MYISIHDFTCNLSPNMLIFNIIIISERIGTADEKKVNIAVLIKRLLEIGQQIERHMLRLNMHLQQN